MAIYDVITLQSITKNGSVFIVNLALADLGVNVFVVPMSLIGECPQLLMPLKERTSYDVMYIVLSDV